MKLKTVTLLAAITQLFSAFGTIPSGVTDAMMIEEGQGALRTLISFAIWYSYFSVSKRVQTTFPQG